MIDTKAIRDVAAVTSDSERMHFKPSTVIAMIDRLEAQHEAIVKLRKALDACSELIGEGHFEKYCGKALKDTEDLK